MIDLVLNIAMLGTVGSVILFFWTKQPKYGFTAAVLLAIVPILQLLLFVFGPKIDVEVDKMRALAVPLQILFSGFCAVCAGVMYRVAKKVQDNQ
jgi:multisubunit Na+/H+ antiporter MnhB subunit